MHGFPGISGGKPGFQDHEFQPILLISQQGTAGAMKLNSNELWFGPLFRIAGYGLLALSLIDIINIFAPPLRIVDPNWQFQTVANLVERAAVPLLGLVLVFSAETNPRIFKYLCWASLVVGVLFLLLVPLGITSSINIDGGNKNQLTQINDQASKIQQVQNRINQAKTPEQVNSILASLSPQGRPPQINNAQQVDQVKNQLLSTIAQGQRSVTQAKANLESRRSALLKNAIRYCLGAVISGVVFLSIWGRTRKALKSIRQRG